MSILLEILVGIVAIYVIISFALGYLMGIPDNEPSVLGSIFMGIFIIFYPFIILINKIKKIKFI